MPQEGISTGVRFFFDSSRAVQNSNRLTGSFGTLDSAIKKVGAAAAAYLTFRTLTASVGKVVETGKSAEVQLTRLETSLGDAEEAFRIYQRSIDIANRTPFETTQVIDAVVSLQAIGVDAFGQLGKTGKDTFQVISDMAGATGRTLEEASLAVIGGITGEMESLKKFGVMSRRLPFKDLEMGTQAWQDALLQHLATLDIYNKGTEKMANTLTGLLSTIRGVWGEFVRHISGFADDMFRETEMTTFFDMVKKSAQDFLKWWDVNETTLKNIARAIGQGFKVMWTIISGIFGIIFRLINAVIKRFQDWWNTFGEGEGALRVFVTKITVLTIAVEMFFERAWKSIAVYAKKIQKAFGQVWEEFKTIASVMGKAISWITGKIKKEVPLWGFHLLDLESLIWTIIVGKLIPLFKSFAFVIGRVLVKGGLLLAVTAAIDLIRKWDELDATGKRLRAQLIALGAALYISKYVKWGNVLKFVGKNLGKYLIVGIGKLLPLLLKLVPVVATLGYTLLKTVVPAVWAFTAALLANPITWIVLAIAGLTAGIIALVKYWPEIKTFGANIISWFKDAAKGFGTWVSDLWNSIVGGVKEMIYETINFFIRQYNKLADLVGLKQIPLLIVEEKVRAGVAGAPERAVSPEAERVLTRPAVTTTVTHKSSANITINEAGNARETAAYVVDFLDRRFAAGGAY